MMIARQLSQRSPHAWVLLLLACCISCFYLGTLNSSCGIATPYAATLARPQLLGDSNGSATLFQATQNSVASSGHLALYHPKPWCQAGSTPPFRFPKIIHQTVRDKHNISCEALASMRSWRDLNPGYEHRLSDDKDCEDFVAENYPEILQIYRHLGSPVERSDLWRYLVLHRYGGVYADSDVKCMRPVELWNQRNGHDADMLAAVTFYHKNGGIKQITNFIMAAMPCHPVLGGVVFEVAAGIAAEALAGQSVKAEAGIIARTGPLALTAAIAAYATQRGAAWPPNGQEGKTNWTGNLVGQVRIMPTEVMAMGWRAIERRTSCEEALKHEPEAYVCHQYFGSWKTHYSFRPTLTYSPDCKYWTSA